MSECLPFSKQYWDQVDAHCISIPIVKVGGTFQLRIKGSVFIVSQESLFFSRGCLPVLDTGIK